MICVQFLFAVVAIVLVGCSSPANSVDGGPAVCESGPAAPAAQVERRVAVTGQLANALRRDGDDIFVVESGDNTVSRFHIPTSTFETLVDVGNERGPWDVFVAGSNLWITNYLANSVTVADRATGDIVVEITHDSFEGPSGIAVVGDYAYVGNVQFRGSGEYGPGSVSVINTRTWEVAGAIPTQRKNPQALDAIDGRLIVVDSGAIGTDGSFIAGSDAAVEIWTPTSDPLAPSMLVSMLGVANSPIGVPGRPAYHNGRIYLPSAIAPVVFVMDATDGTWLRGADNPIRLYETTRNALNHLAIGDHGLLHVTAFNEDALYIVDTRCDAVLQRVELESSTMLAGPHGVVVVGDDVYFSLSLANELGRVRLDFAGAKK